MFVPTWTRVFFAALLLDCSYDTDDDGSFIFVLLIVSTKFGYDSISVKTSHNVCAGALTCIILETASPVEQQFIATRVTFWILLYLPNSTPTITVLLVVPTLIIFALTNGSNDNYFQWYPCRCYNIVLRRHASILFVKRRMSLNRVS